MSSPLISVIIPVYNIAGTLERCVQSVAEQTYHNLEIILVDDGSTDQSGELCDRLASQDARIKVIHQKNRGLSGARNAALEIFRGEFITFVDSDDWLARDAVEILYHELVSQQVKMSVGRITEAKNYSVSPETSKIGQRSRVYSSLDALVAMLLEQDILISACGKLYACELFQRVRFPEGKLYEDVGTTYRLILACPQVAFVDQVVYYYYQNPDSIIHQTFSSKKLDLITLTDQMCDDITTQVLNNPKFTESPDPQVAASLIKVSDAVRGRRLHARFSILRQMVMVDPETLPLEGSKSTLSRPEFLRLRSEIVQYLHQHKSGILRNSLSSRRDRLAMYSLLLGLPVFTLAWKLYSRK